MQSWRPAFEVARWEFWRYVKPKQQFVGMLITFVIGGGFMMVSRLADRDGARRAEIAVVGADQLPVLTLEPTTMTLRGYPAAAEASLRRRVLSKELEGLLLIRSRDHAELVVRRSAPWIAELHALMGAARREVMTEQADLSPHTIAAILAPPELAVTYQQQSAEESTSERITLVVVLALMLMAVFMGMSYIFASITGEKQIRVTEQIITAIPAQAWIDGKILGLMGVSIVTVLAQVTAFVAIFVLLLTAGSVPFALPASLGDPALVTLILVFAVLGLLFWFAFLAAIAALIDDPQTSTRGSLLFLPLFATLLAFFVLKNPDSGVSRVLALLPPTAPSAMPGRLLTGDVAVFEIALSGGLLIAGVAVLRIVAGRIFRVAMLMYGKEPSWSEVRRWASGRH